MIINHLNLPVGNWLVSHWKDAYHQLYLQPLPSKELPTRKLIWLGTEGIPIAAQPPPRSVSDKAWFIQGLSEVTSVDDHRVFLRHFAVPLTDNSRTFKPSSWSGISAAPARWIILLERRNCHLCWKNDAEFRYA
jgi:hypothetical protein